MDKKLYFAPMEGITGHIYRNTHAELFGMCDAYYAPFITPVENEKLSLKCLRDIEPEKNKVNLRVQVLTNSPDAFFRFEDRICAMGYDYVNINLGCPSGTVVKKDRGAGFLRNTDGLYDFLRSVFESTSLRVSVKTRVGFFDADEFDALMEIYNRFPLDSLIVHPRTRQDYYKGDVRMDAFQKAYHTSKNPLCYNGNILTTDDYNRICTEYSEIKGVMIGRGAIANPAIFREIRGGDKLRTEELIEFTNILAERYYEVLRSDAYTLHKLKEIWLYMMSNYPEEKKILKAVKKSSNVADLKYAISRLKEIN